MESHTCQFIRQDKFVRKECLSGEGISCLRKKSRIELTFGTILIGIGSLIGRIVITAFPHTWRNFDAEAQPKSPQNITALQVLRGILNPSILSRILNSPSMDLTLSQSRLRYYVINCPHVTSRSGFRRKRSRSPGNVAIARRRHAFRKYITFFWPADLVAALEVLEISLVIEASTIWALALIPQLHDHLNVNMVWDTIPP